MTDTLSLPTRLIGSKGVGAIGLGAMPMSIEGRPDEARSIATIHAALDAGVTLIDTADAYHLFAGETGHNERLIREALDTYEGDRSNVLIATKGGHLRPGDGSWTQDGTARHLIEAAEASREALQVEAIDLYQFHRPDPEVPLQDSLNAIKHLLDDGTILMAGVSNFFNDQIDTAMEILDGRVVSVQNRFSPGFRSSMTELEHCAELGIAFLPYSPLGGIGNAAGLGQENTAFQQIADERGVSPQQVALAWELGLSTVVIPIPGASRPETIRDSARAAELHLTDEEMARLNA